MKQQSETQQRNSFKQSQSCESVTLTQLLNQTCEMRKRRDQLDRSCRQLEKKFIQCKGGGEYFSDEYKGEISESEKQKFFNTMKNITKQQQMRSYKDLLLQKKKKLEQQLADCELEINKEQKQSQVLSGIFKEYSVTETDRDIGLVDPQTLFQEELIKKNTRMVAQMQRQKQIKAQIFLRVLKIYQNNWKIYFMKKYFTLATTDKIMFLQDSNQGRPEVLSIIHEKKVAFKTKHPQNQDQQIDLCMEIEQQQNKNKIIDVIFNNMHFLNIFHKILLPHIFLPYKIFIEPSILYIDNICLDKRYIKKYFDQEIIEKALGKFQADLQIICRAIGHEPVPFLIFDEAILKSFLQNQGAKRLSNKSKRRDCLRQLRMQYIAENNDIQKQHNQGVQIQSQGILELKSQNRSLSSQQVQQRLGSSKQNKNSDEDDQFFQILQ